jgi:hypothetical protein
VKFKASIVSAARGHFVLIVPGLTPRSRAQRSISV